MSRRRQLSEEEEALWNGFVRSITPLRRSQKIPSHEKAHLPAAAKKLQPQRPATPPPMPPTPPLAPLERRLKQRVARGRAPIDARIDLHGFTQNEAYVALLRFLERAQADGRRIVLVVTGKGGGGRPHDRASERGVLRRQVPHWLELPEFRALVTGFDNAHAGHGGDGALYLRLRRRR
jgi:DNA-nicking Smr family endonuclease